MINNRYKKNRRVHRYGKTFASCLFAVVLLLSLVGCSGGNEASGERAAKKEGIRIGFSMDSFLIERWQRDRDVFVSQAGEMGAEVNVQNANGNLEEQISQIEYFIEKKMDVIVIVATDCEGLSETVAKARQAGCKVIAYDRLIRNANVDLFVSFDNEMVGTLMGEAILSALPHGGKVLMMNGPLTDSNVPQIMQGFENTLSGQNLQVVKTGYAPNWRAEDAYTFTDEYLQETNGDLPDAIMCGNDSLAGFAVKALAERRAAGGVIVTGQDADLEACQRIVEGTQHMTVYKPVEKLAARAAEMAVALAKGEKLDTVQTIDDGSAEVPYERLTPIAVTKKNIDEVIVGNYHQRKDVYLNIREDGKE